MPTEPVNRHLKSGKIVRNAIVKFRPKAVAKVNVLPIAEDAAAVDYGAVLDDLHSRLIWVHDDLFAADSAYMVELADDTKRQKQRDTDFKALTRAMVRVRGLFVNCYEPVRIEEFGFHRQLHRDPEKLLLQGQQLVNRLRESDLPLPEAISEGVAQNPLELANIVEAPLKQLEESLKHVSDEFRDAQLIRPDHDESGQRLKRIFDGAALIARGIFLLADEKELADRVKPSTTKSGQTERDPDEIFDEIQDQPDEDDPTEPAGDTPAETDFEFPEDDSDGSFEEP